MSEYIIETEDLTKYYDNQVCVDTVSIHVPRGKIYALLGKNGAGKTTTMKMLLNLVKPTSGTIHIYQKDCSVSPPNIYARMGALIEEPCFYENLTGRENLEIIARLRNCNSSTILDNALQAVNLEKNDKKTFGKYSMGMKQRLGIAAAIMHKPDILILDEPINGLDPVGIQEMREYLQKYCRDYGAAIFISSHMLNEIEQIADIIGVMDHGKLLEEQTMEDLHKQLCRYIEYEVSDVNSALLILKEQLKITNTVIAAQKHIRLYGSDINRNEEINRHFVSNNISVIQIRMQEEKLEEYFTKLIGGTNNG